jgi:hypothetical protein
VESSYAVKYLAYEKQMMKEKERVKVLRLKVLVSKQANKDNKAHHLELQQKLKGDRINSRLEAHREKIQNYRATIS